jgi:hypothetical protein
MALQLAEQPKSINPAYNQNRFILQQDRGFVDTKFRYSFYLKVTLKVEPSEPNPEFYKLNCYPIENVPNSFIYKGYFDLKEILSNSKLQKENPIIIVNYEYGEQYATTTSGSVVEYMGDIGSYTSINGALNVEEYRAFEPTDFIDTVTSGNIAYNAFTDFTTTRESLRITSHELLFGGLSAANFTGDIKFYNGNTYLTSANGFSGIPNYAWSKLKINNALTPINATRIEARVVRTSNGLPITPTYNYNIVQTCRYTPVTCYFTNKYGMKDNFLFKLKNNKSDTIERSNFKRLDRYLGDYQPATVTYSNILTRKHILNTDWVSEVQMNTLLRDLAESNYVQLYYGTELIGGSKASFKIVFNQLYNDSFGDLGVEAGWGFTFSTLTGTYTYTAPSDITDTFADGAMINLIADITSTTTIDSVYDMSVGNSSQSYGEIVFTAKSAGAIYSNLAMTFDESTTPNSARATLQNNISGQDADPQNFIDCIPNVSEFQFKKKENEPLFQLQCEFTEANTFTRQKL